MSWQAGRRVVRLAGWQADFWGGKETEDKYSTYFSRIFNA